ncbi:MAG: hypothetical protein DCC68_20755 [Planctomycetota bacterium]|nr:MAG: hypothetical protein DCC68_20755 [Planctomycetota bacterium]
MIDDPAPPHERMRLRRGRTLALSLPRRLVCDVLHFSRNAPSVPMQRRMRLAELVAARNAWPRRLSWCAIFLKGYAQVTAERPELRRAYLRFPWPRLYEHPENVASFAVEREYEGEAGLFFARVNRPERLSLARLDALVRHYKCAPIDAIASYRRALRLTRLPRPVRRSLWWLGLELDGMFRACLFGTLAVSAAASRGAAGLHVLSPLTTTLNYSPFEPDGSIDVRITYDHRVVDGGAVADALVRLEAVLSTSILDELRAGPRDGFASGAPRLVRLAEPVLAESHGGDGLPLKPR